MDKSNNQRVLDKIKEAHNWGEEEAHEHYTNENRAKNAEVLKEMKKESAIDRLKNNLESINKSSLSDLKSELKQNSVKGGGSSGSGGTNPMKTGTLSPFNMKKGGVVSSASKRADGIATKGKTKGRMV